MSKVILTWNTIYCVSVKWKWWIDGFFSPFSSSVHRLVFLYLQFFSLYFYFSFSREWSRTHCHPSKILLKLIVQLNRCDLKPLIIEPLGKLNEPNWYLNFWVRNCILKWFLLRLFMVSCRCLTMTSSYACEWTWRTSILQETYKNAFYLQNKIQ